MFFEAPLIASLSLSRTTENDDMASTKRRVGSAVAGAGKRRRAASTSLPLKSLCLNQESSPLNVNLESIFNYLPAPAGRRNRNSWNPTSFKQFKAASKPTYTHPRTTSIAASAPTLAKSTPIPPPTHKTTISSLPSELLCLIFDSYSTPSHTSSPFGDSAEPDPSTHPYGFFSVSHDRVWTPLPLTHVCAKWRSTAIAHKGLWGSIAFALQGVEEEYQEESFHRWASGKLELLKLFLARARGVPLKLALSASEDAPQRVVAQVVKLVCRHAGRWQDLRMDLGSVSAVQTLRDELALAVAHSPKPESTFGALRSLQLELAVEDEEEEYDGQEEGGDAYGDAEELTNHSSLTVRDIYALVLPRAPRLDSLVLDDLFFTCSEGEERDVVPWSQLKRLTITSNSIGARRVLGICAKAGRLEELKVWRVGLCEEDVDGWGPLSPSSTRIELPNLRSLELTTLTDPTELLDRLSLPALRRVDVDVQAIGRGLLGDDRADVVSILGPLNRLVEGVQSPSAPVDVRCGIKASCVLPEEPRVVDSRWMEGRGLRALARASAEVEVYKYGSSRGVRL